MNKKGIKRAIVSVMILVTLGIFLLGCGKEKGYRMMQVYQVNGTATIERENIGGMNAYENLNLVSGDKVEVAADSYIRLKVDEDKFVLAEASSEFSIVASGTADSGRTEIDLKKGAVTVEVQNKLSDDASFEVTTPNSVMAVRGTVFRISTDTDEAGKPITKITILEGEVSVQKKDESGALSEEKHVVAGKEAIIYNEAEKIEIKILDEVSIIDVPLEVLEFLYEIVTERRELVITSDEIQELIENLKSAPESESKNDTEPEQEKSSEPTQDSEQESEPEQETIFEQTVDSEQKSGSEQNTDTTPTIESESDNGSEQDTSSEQESSQEQESESEENITYTVTFMYNGESFATQVVEAGELVSKPFLMPAKSGDWDFDFSTPVESDITIEFAE